MVRVTSARPRGARPDVPAKMTSSILPPRSDLAPCSPITQLRASTTFDLPDPFGPTTQVMPGSKASVVVDANDLKPRSVSDFRCIALPDVGRVRSVLVADVAERPHFVDQEVDRHRDQDGQQLRPVFAGLQPGPLVKPGLGQVERRGGVGEADLDEDAGEGCGAADGEEGQELFQPWRLGAVPERPAPVEFEVE